MPMFMDPGVIFPGGLNSSEQQFISEVLKAAKASGYKRVVTPYAGTLSLANLAVQAGFKPSQIEASDYQMMPAILGYAVASQSLEPLKIRAVGFSDEELLDPAVAIYAQVYLRISKNAGNVYFHNMLVDLKKRREEHLKEIRLEIDAMREKLGGMHFLAVDMWEHLQQVVDDEKTIVLADPPTSRNTTERFFDTQSKMSWISPAHTPFQEKCDYKILQEMFDTGKALLLYRQERMAGYAVGDTIFARVAEREGYISYLTSNRGEEVTALSKGKKIKRPAESKLEPLDCSMLPLTYQITEESTIQIIPITTANAQYYRKLWTHNFVGSSATWNRAVLIDGYVAAVFGISKMSDDALFVWYVMKVPHKVYRLGRLCYMLAQNRCFINTLLDPVAQEKVEKIRTAMLTKYAENKEVRGIMTLVNRQTDPTNGYKLTYEAEIRSKRNNKDALREWLAKEKKWTDNRAPSTN